MWVVVFLGCSDAPDLVSIVRELDRERNPIDFRKDLSIPNAVTIRQLVHLLAPSSAAIPSPAPAELSDLEES